MPAAASVVIPAHNEERGISRTLTALHDGLAEGDLAVIVVCNGCTDATAAVVRRGFPSVRVLEIPEASKALAVEVGNAAAEVFPRVHLDADVAITGRSVQALIAPLSTGTLLATAPRRTLATAGCSALIRAYYYVWERLPQVQAGLFGRGVFALSAEGQRRVSAQPRLMSDDLAASEAFAPHERAVIGSATVTVVPPRRTRDLIRRRVRVVTGNAQATAAGVRGAESATTLGTLWRMARREPGVALRLPVFVGVAVVAKLGAGRAVRAGDYTTWLRDESSRA